MGELIYAILRIAGAFFIADDRPEARKFTTVCCIGVLLIVAVLWWAFR